MLTELPWTCALWYSSKICDLRIAWSFLLDQSVQGYAPKETGLWKLAFICCRNF